jgi:hypothetical protein
VAPVSMRIADEMAAFRDGAPLSCDARGTQKRLSLVHDVIQDETDHNNQSNDIDDVIHFPDRL